MPAGAELAEKLQLAAGTPIYKLKRIHLIDRRPMSVAVSYVVVTAIANVDEIGISLYDYFRRNKVEMGSLRSGQRSDGRRRYPSGAAALGADAAADRAPDAVRPP